MRLLLVSVFGLALPALAFSEDATTFTSIKVRILTVSVCFSPDGSKVASSGEDIRVWDGLAGKVLLTIPGKGEAIFDVNFSPDGERLVSASNNGIVRVWDAKTGQEMLKINASPGNIAWRASFSPDGKRIVSASLADTTVWEASSGKQLFVVKGAGRGVCFSKDGKYLAAVVHLNSKEVKLIDATTGEAVKSFTASNFMRPDCTLSFSHDSKKLGIPDGNTFRVVEIDSGKELYRVQHDKGSILGSDFSADGKWLATAGDQSVIIADASTGVEVGRLACHKSDLPKCVRFSADSTRLIGCHFDQGIKIWDVKTLIKKK